MSGGLSDACLVLGGSGFLGAHVVSQAVRIARSGANWTTVWSASRDPASGPLFGVDPAGGGVAVKLRELDAGREGDLDLVLEEARPARVVVCAALSSVPECEASPERAFALNVRFPRAAAMWCAANGARLVHVSTDLVFGRANPPATGFREEDPPAPVSEYGRTKAEGERRVLDACPGALVVRLPLLYGPSGGRGRGASDSLLASIERGERPALFTDEWRTPLEVGNAARALIELLHSPTAGILHVAGPDRVTRFELGLHVIATLGHGAEEARSRVRASTRAEAGMDWTRAEDASLDASRARSILRTPLLGLREGLREDLAQSRRARGAEAR